MTTKQSTIGFIGLGIMGLPMSINLLKAGYRVVGYARNQNKCSDFPKQGGEWAKSCQEVGEAADILITNVPDSPQVKSVLFDKDGAFEGLSEGNLVVDMSTISPQQTVTIAEQLSTKGVGMLDAPVSGGNRGAIEGTLSIMVGGSEQNVLRMMPLFQILGKQIVHIGDSGAGQFCKSCNQMLIAQTINAVSETFAYAEQAGMDVAKIRQALMGGFAASRVLEVHGLRMLENDYQPGFKADLHLKDMNIVADSCRSLDYQAPATELARQQIEKLVEQGHTQLDSSAIHLLRKNKQD